MSIYLSLFFLLCQVVLSDSKHFCLAWSNVTPRWEDEEGGKKQKTKSVFSPSSSKENTSADGVTHRRLCTCSCCATTSSPNLSVRVWKTHASAPKFVYIYIFFLLFKKRIIIDRHLLCFVRISVLHTQSSLSALLRCQRGLFLRPGVIYCSSSNHFKSM